MLDNYDLDLKVSIINRVREKLHELSPFASEPVDLITWVKIDDVHANDYNPNKVAPPEMELLRHSIQHDGYTQPVVTWEVEQGREEAARCNRLLHDVAYRDSWPRNDQRNLEHGPVEEDSVRAFSVLPERLSVIYDHGDHAPGRIPRQRT